MKAAIARGCMVDIANGATPSDLASMGITETDYKKMTSFNSWQIADRVRVRSTIDALLGGSLDAAGMNRFELPVEYVAAVLRCFVKPVNMLKACKWLETSMQECEVLARDGAGTEPIRAAQLFALVCELGSQDQSEVDRAISAFEAKTGWRQDQIAEVTASKK